MFLGALAISGTLAGASLAAEAQSGMPGGVGAETGGTAPGGAASVIALP